MVFKFIQSFPPFIGGVQLLNEQEISGQYQPPFLSHLSGSHFLPLFFDSTNEWIVKMFSGKLQDIL